MGGWEAVLIAGPTASGKSALGLALARAYGGAVVNADSMQVYRDLRVLSARPDPTETALVPHRLYGTVDGAVNHSVAHYLREATAVLAELGAAGRLPVVVGGTGLYLDALANGLSEVPPVPDAVRERVRREAEGRSTASLHADLAGLDPEGAAALRPGDSLRVMRALEVLFATGRPLRAFHGTRTPGPLTGRRVLKVFLAADRPALARRIDARFRAMAGGGALDEVAALAARGLDPMLPVMRAHGVPALLAHHAGALDLESAIARGQADTRRYAKRQFTWFRHRAGPGWAWLAPDDARAAVEQALARGPGAGCPAGGPL